LILDAAERALHEPVTAFKQRVASEKARASAAGMIVRDTGTNLGEGMSVNLEHHL